MNNQVNGVIERGAVHLGITQMKPILTQQEDFVDDWIALREAAALMHVNEKQLRMMEGGEYRYYPHLARIQPIPKGKIFMLRSQVIEWRKQMERKALEKAAPKKPIEEFGRHTYAPIAEDLVALGAEAQLLRSLGVRN